LLEVHPELSKRKASRDNKVLMFELVQLIH